MAAYERSEHEKKYDRQMRLWGGHGQMNLETAHICCLGSGATASETLKNLVLPNVGRFTLIDDALATAADKNSNFFVDLHSVGRPRAEVVKELLEEMNPEVKGHSILQNPRTLLSGDLSFFTQFSLVVVSDPSLPVRSLLPLAAHLWTANIPLVLVQVKGLLGSVRLQVREHAITESHPGNDRYDLFIHPEQRKRWPELQEYVKQFTVFKDDAASAANAAASSSSSSASTAAASSSTSSSCSSTASSTTVASAAPALDLEEHGHIPYLAVLAHCIDRWAAEHAGSLPRSYDEKTAFKAFIRASSWAPGAEGNFEEAVEFAHRAYELPKLDRYVQQVFDDPSASDPSILRSSHFWLLVRAVREFMAAEGGGVCAPVSQSLPDMHCKTAHYVALKQLFQRKAEADLAAVGRHLAKLLVELGLDAGHVPQQEVDAFVRNVRTLRLIRTRSLVQEYGSDGLSDPATGASFAADVVREMLEEEADMAAAAEEDAEAEAEGMSDSAAASSSSLPRPPLNPHNIHWYLALRAADIFLEREGRAPGTHLKGSAATGPVPVPQLEADMAALSSIQQSLLARVGLSDALAAPVLPCLAEVVRSGSSEPHVTAAFLGGLASQLGLKIILRQFVPLNNTVLWNGLFASSTTLQL